MQTVGLRQELDGITGPNTLPRLMVWLSQSAAFLRFMRRQVGWVAYWNNRTAWRACLRGFTPDAFTVYALDRNDLRLYLSDYLRAIPATRINGQYNSIVNNKLAAWTLLAGSCAPVPELLGTVERGSFRPYPRGSVSVRHSLDDLLDRYRKLVLKPVRGLKGLDILFFEQTESGTVVNGQPSTRQEVLSITEQLHGYLVTEFIEQAAYARDLYPRTTNTIRVVTLWDSTTNQPFVAAAAQRIGNSRSFPVDNWKGGRGGLSALVDLQTGKLGKASFVGQDGRLMWFDSHPETGARIAGEAVPGWATLVEGLLAAAARLFFAPFIGWDVVVRDEGFCILETNGAPGLRTIQVHQPLLTDPRVRRFFQEHGVIRG